MLGGDRSVSKLSTLENRELAMELLLAAAFCAPMPATDSLVVASVVSLSMLMA